MDTLNIAQAEIERGHRLRDDWDLMGAEAAFRAAARLAPHAANPLHNLGQVLMLLQDAEGAEKAFRTALTLEPGRAITVHALGTCLVAQGRFTEGFPLTEARYQRVGHPQTDIGVPRWSGEPIAGHKVLIWPEEGFGDQIQFARYAPLLQAVGAVASWICSPALAPLFDGQLDVEIISAEGTITLPDFDFWIGSSSLPTLFCAEPVPVAPYLHATAAGSAHIGVVTKGNPRQANDRNRSMPPNAAEQLLGLPGAINLLPEATGARSFADTAQIIAGLGHIITVDTAVAHLAGAMGKPVSILLAAVGADWRWMPERDRTPWYPTARLFRQSSPGDWGGAINAAAAERFIPVGVAD